MNIITEQSFQNNLNDLEQSSQKTIKNLKSLHRREKDIKIRILTEKWVNCYLDLYALRKHDIDSINDPDYLRLVVIRNNMIKLYW